MLFLLFNIFIAALPAAGLALVLSIRKEYGTEAYRLIGGSFLFGAISVIPAAILVFILGHLVSAILPASLTQVLRTALRAFFVVSLAEESTKALCIRVILRRSGCRESRNGTLLCAVAGGLGFAFLENLFYSLEAPSSLMIRSITAVPLHAFLAGILGYYLSSSSGKKRSAAWGFLAVLLLHGGYDFLIFSGYPLSILVVPLLLITGGILKILTSRTNSEYFLSNHLTGRS